jgi:hypothetical protein
MTINTPFCRVFQCNKKIKCTRLPVGKITMNFLERLQNGWKLTMSSFKILRANKQLIIFPVLSGVSLMLIIGSFVVASLARQWVAGG